MTATTALITAVRALLGKLRHCEVCETALATHVGDDGCDDDDFAICDQCDTPMWADTGYQRDRPPEVDYAVELRVLQDLLLDHFRSSVDQLREKHLCRNAPTKKNRDGYGEAIENCIEREDGSFWVGNGEYGSRVNYCPFCGAEAPDQMEVKP